LPDNYLSRPSNYQLVEFSKQLPFVEDFRLKRIQNVRLICKILSKNNKLILPKTTNEYADTFHSLPVIVLMKKKEDLYKFLLKNNYDIAKYYYRDCSNLEIFSEYFRPCKNISQYSSNVLCIPVYHSIPKDYLKRLARTINDFYKL
jgi:dTDP-4-amino-4,6-dideoxygalactose transaminase